MLRLPLSTSCAMNFGIGVGLDGRLPRRIGQTCAEHAEAGLASHSATCVFGRRRMK